MAAVFVALRAVTVVSDSLLEVLAGDVRGSVLMASVTGVLPEIGWIVVAGLAACLVVAVEPEEAAVVEVCRFPCIDAMAGCAVVASVCVEAIFGQVGFVALDAASASSQRFVIEACRFPCLDAMAGCAIVASACVDVILWLLTVVAGVAIAAELRIEAFMPECAQRFFRVTPLVVGVAFETTVRRQSPVEERFARLFRQGGSINPPDADVAGLVAAHALHGERSPERFVAGEAILFDLRVALHQLAGIEQAIRKCQSEADEHGEKCGDDGKRSHIISHPGCPV
jgi:hypothetical protein